MLARCPKTLCDAIAISRELRIRYLWIDAPGIIQNDNDWKRESVRMANNLKGRRRHPSLWITSPRQRVPCTFEFSLLDGEEKRPYDGPLAMRGSALKESYLARRLLNFMPGAISWRCRVLECSDRSKMNTEMDMDGVSIVRRCLDCAITYSSDQSVALQGLAIALEQ